MTGDLNGDVNGDPAAAPAKKQTKRKPRFTTVEHLLGPNGVAYVANEIPEKFARVAKGPGHEFGDFARLVGLYREWTRKMYPHATHEHVMQRVKALSKTREVRATVFEFKERARMENGEATANEGDAMEDVQEEDVFFPDDEDANDANDANDDAAFPDDEEQEWNDLRGSDDDGDDDEMAVLRELERRETRETSSKEKETLHEEKEALRAAEEKSARFDEARREGLDVNFDESSEDDEDFEIATRAARPKPIASRTASDAPRGKARKKVKRMNKREKPASKISNDVSTKFPTATAPDPPDEDETVRVRKTLGGGGGKRVRARPEDEVDGSDPEDAPEQTLRRPRRKVVAALSDSDDDDAPIPASMGGDALTLEGDLPTTSRPSFLYDEDE